MDTRRIYLVGAGAIARAHADGAESLNFDVEVHATDLSATARKSFAAEYPDATVHEDTETMLATEPRDDDVVVVATPPFAHVEPALQAFESGRHVLCEKPLALSTAAAERIVDAADDHDRLLGYPTCRTHSPRTDLAADLVADGDIGDPYHVTWTSKNVRTRPGIEYQPESKWFLDRDKSGGGPVMDWGPYDVYQLGRLFDPVAVEVRNAWTAKPTTDNDVTEHTNTVEYHAGATLAFELDDDETVIVDYERSWCTHGEERDRFEVEGTAGALRFNWLGWADDEDVTLATDDDGDLVTEDVTPDDEPQDVPIGEFFKAIDGKDAVIETGETALFNTAVLRAIYDCAETGEPSRVPADRNA